MKNATKKTARELRKIFFDTDYYAVYLADELTNKEVRDTLYALDNQDEEFNCALEGSCVYIWK